MQIITPIDITEDMIVSPIAEPDSSVGEVEWVDPKIPIFTNSVADGGNYFASCTADDGYTYFAGDEIAKVSSTGVASYVSDLTGTARCAVALGSYVYFGTLSGQIYRMNTSTNAINQITVTGSSTLYSAINIGDGYLYFGASGKVVVLNVSTSATTVYEMGSGIFQSVVRGFDGMLYFTTYSLASANMYRFDTESLTGSLFLDIGTSYRTATLGDDGLIYLMGGSGQVAVVNVSSESVSYFGSLNASIFGISKVINGVFIACGRDENSNGLIVSVDTSSQTVEKIYTDSTRPSDVIRSVSVNNDKYYFCFGDEQFLTMTQSYSVGDQVMLSSTHKVYQAVTVNNNDPSIGAELIPPSWVELYATNKYRMFDYVINTESSGSGDLILIPNTTTTTLSIFGLTNISSIGVEVRQDDEFTAVIYSSTKDLSLDTPLADSIANESLYQSKVIFDDLPTWDKPWIKITITKANVLDPSLKWGIGSIVLGNARTMGTMTYSSSTSRTSYDTVETDDYGNETIVSRPSSEYTTFEMVIQPQYADYVERILKDSLNKPRVYIGDKKDGEKIFTFGRYERSPISYDDPLICTTTLKVRGLV
jgi:hypothetical protein